MSCIGSCLFCIFSLAGTKAQTETLLKMGQDAGVWDRNWAPPGGKSDLYSYLKEKLKNMRKREKEDEKMESRYEEYLKEKRAKLDG